MNKPFLCVFLFLLAVTSALTANDGTKRASSSPSVRTEDSGSSTTAKASLTQLLLDKEKSLPEAQKRKDVDYFKNITTDDFLEVAADAKVYTRDELLEALNVVDLQNYSIYDAKVLPLDNNAAVVTYDAVVQMTIGDDHAPRYQHISSVWVNQNGKWLLKFQQATAAQ
ncbi:MAG TPA: nuclear transport factor 2 family protein [Terriglobales bacterium]|nr:nuclear transport factor 2 family protein [Terriglobales bacterium]